MTVLDFRLVVADDPPNRTWGFGLRFPNISSKLPQQTNVAQKCSIRPVVSLPRR
jgi:hypothetical protein